MKTMLMPSTRRPRVGRPRTTPAGEEMMTTITLPVSLLVEVKLEAVKRRTSVKALVIEGLRLVLARARKGGRP